MQRANIYSHSCRGLHERVAFGLQSLASNVVSAGSLLAAEYEVMGSQRSGIPLYELEELGGYKPVWGWGRSGSKFLCMHLTAVSGTELLRLSRTEIGTISGGMMHEL